MVCCVMCRATILDRANEKLTPPPPPHFNDGKMACFALRANSSLILGGGGGGVNFSFSSVQDSDTDIVWTCDT